MSEPDPAVLHVLDGARRSRRWTWIALGVVAIASVAGFVAYQGKPVHYRTAAVERGPLVQTITAVGQLEALQSVDVSSQLSGQVAEVLVDANDRVTAGQVLARLDATPFELAVRQSRAQLDAARASQRQAEVSVTSARLLSERTARLVEKGAATSVEAEDARLALDQAEASLANARAVVAQRAAALADAEEDLTKTTIKAPITGVVTQRSVDPGQTVVSAMSASTLFEIGSDLGKLKAELAVDEADVGKVKAGLTGTFTVSAWPDRTFPTTVASVDLAPDADSTVVAYDAELRIDNADGALRPGMTATAVVETGRLDDMLLVPSGALRWRPEGTPPTDHDQVYTLVDGEPVAHTVTTLGTDGLHTAVAAEASDSLHAGDLLVTGKEAK